MPPVTSSKESRPQEDMLADELPPIISFPSEPRFESLEKTLVQEESDVILCEIEGLLYLMATSICGLMVAAEITG
jgi:hypothetical protein